MNNFIYYLIIVILIIYIYVRYQKQVIEYKLSKMKMTPRPIWLSDISNQIVTKKLNEKITINQVSLLSACNLLRNCDNNGLTWEEFKLKCLDAVKNINMNFDIIIGIKSGGAIVADCLSYHFNIPVDYIKVHKYGTKPLFRRIYEFSKKYDYNTNITGNVHIKNKNVLLVDDTCLTGSTMKISKEYLMKQNPKSIKSLCMFGELYKGKDITIAYNKSYLPLPWSYDP